MMASDFRAVAAAWLAAAYAEYRATSRLGTGLEVR